MASAVVPCDQLLCSICLDVFTEPVSTPCGHNYCKACITGYWDRSSHTQCPLCNKRFRRRPQLHINTGFRDMVEHFKNMMVILSGEPHQEIHVGPGEVPCDICQGPKLKAEKTCLVCLASYCQVHLEPHQRVKNLKKHKLTDPVVNLEEQMCKKHDKMFELFCRVEQTCICFMCLKDNHVTHDAIPLERAFKERKAYMEEGISKMKMIESTKSKIVKKINSTLEQRKKHAQKEVADIGEVFTQVVASLQSNQAKLVELIEEKQKETEKEDRDDIKQLEQEITELRRKRSEMEQLLQTEDHLHFLQKTSNVYRLHSEELFDMTSSIFECYSDVNESHVKMVKQAAEKMEKMLSKEMDVLIKEVKFSDGCDTDTDETDAFCKDVWLPPEDKLMMIQQNDAMDVTLNTYTANYKLKVLDDGKRLMYKGLVIEQQQNALFTARFQNLPLVLAEEGFSSGRFYYEVDVTGTSSWILGVARESINRHIVYWPGANDGAWTITSKNSFGAAVRTNAQPQRVGVFVDYEKGEVSFYDPDSRTVIYSYTECTFTEDMAPLKYLLYSLTGTSTKNRSKLYPIFGIYGHIIGEELRITKVASKI